MKKEYLITITILLIFSCNKPKECPTEVIIDHIRTPNHVEISKSKYNNNAIVFLSELGEKIGFVKDSSFDNKIVRRKEQMVSCPETEARTVNIYFDQEESEFIYKSQNEGILKINYYPDINTILDPYDQAQIDDVFTIYRMNMSIEIPELLTGISKKGIAMWNNPESFDFHAKKYPEPYSIGDTTYDEVFYFDTQGNSILFYSRDYDILGFRDSRSVKWIKL